MPFKPGHKQSVGRPKGSRNKDSLALIEEANKLGISPFRVMLYFASGDWKSLGYESKTVEKYGKETDVITPELRLKGASEAAQFLYPKLASIQVGESDPTDGMTLDQEIVAIEQLLQKKKIEKAKANGSR